MKSNLAIARAFELNNVVSAKQEKRLGLTTQPQSHRDHKTERIMHAMPKNESKECAKPDCDKRLLSTHRDHKTEQNLFVRPDFKIGGDFDEGLSLYRAKTLTYTFAIICVLLELFFVSTMTSYIKNPQSILHILLVISLIFVTLFAIYSQNTAFVYQRSVTKHSNPRNHRLFHISQLANNPFSTKLVVCIIVALILIVTPLVAVNSNITENSAANSVAYAEENVEEQLADSVEERIDALDLGMLQDFWDKYGNDTLNSDLKQALRDVISGEMSGYSQIYGLCVRALLKSLLGFLPAMLTIVIICILKSTLSGMTSEFNQKSTIDMVHFVCYASIIAVAGVEIADAVRVSLQTVGALQQFSDGVFPVLLTLTGALGGAVSIGVYSPLVAILTVFISGLITSIIVPLFLSSTVFAVVGNMSGGLKLDKLVSATRGIGEWILGIVFGIFVTVLTVQGAVGATADRVTVGATRFALSSYVPIIGGYLSEGFDLVYASTVLLKNAVGYVGIIVLFCIVLLPIAKLAMLIITMRLTAAIVEPLGEKPVSDMLYSVSKNLRFLMTAVAGIAFLFFVIMLLLIMAINIL